MDANQHRTDLVNFFRKAYKQFIRDEYCYYPDKIGYNTELLMLCTEKEDQLEKVLFEFFDDVKRSRFIALFELNVIIENAVSVYLSSVKYFTKKVMFLTWRPAEDMDIKVYKDIVIKLLSKKIIKNYIIVFEQKGKDYSNIGKGKHIHCLLKFNYNRNYNEFKKQIKKYFFETHKQAKCSLDIIDLDKKEFIESKLYYMGYLLESNEIITNPNLTYKKGENLEHTKEKLECLQYDRLFQRKYNLMDNIENNYFS